MALRTLAFQELSRGRPVSTHKMTPESIRMTAEQISEKGSQSRYSSLLSVSGLSEVLLCPRAAGRPAASPPWRCTDIFK